MLYFSEFLLVKHHDAHESNLQATKLIWFDDVDIPNVEKLCLAGSGLAEAKLYHDYLEHGMIFEVRKRGVVLDITRNSVVTLFSKSTFDEFIDYILVTIVTLSLSLKISHFTYKLLNTIKIRKV